jgi:hypothetical protein
MTVPAALALRHSLTAGDELKTIFDAGLQVVQRDPSVADLTLAGLEIDWKNSEDPRDCGGAADWSGLARMTWHTSPYRHARGHRLFAPMLADQWLSTLEAVPRWTDAAGTFYSAKATVIERAWCPVHLAGLVEGPGLRQLEEAASSLFGQPLRLHGPVVAHRMGPGHSVGVHSDAPFAGEETHRIVVFIARQPKPTDGGHFLLFEPRAGEKARWVLPLANNSAVAFELNHDSYHAVTRMVAGNRFSLILSFK